MQMAQAMNIIGLPHIDHSAEHSGEASSGKGRRKKQPLECIGGLEFSDGLDKKKCLVMLATKDGRKFAFNECGGISPARADFAKCAFDGVICGPSARVRGAFEFAAKEQYPRQAAPQPRVRSLKKTPTASFSKPKPRSPAWLHIRRESKSTRQQRAIRMALS